MKKINTLLFLITFCVNGFTQNTPKDYILNSDKNILISCTIISINDSVINYQNEFSNDIFSINKDLVKKIHISDNEKRCKLFHNLCGTPNSEIEIQNEIEYKYKHLNDINPIENNNTLKIMYGFSFLMDYGLIFSGDNNYTASDPGLALTLAFFTRIPFKEKYFIYPTISYTFYGAESSATNKNNSFTPPISINVPYSTVGNGWSDTHYSDDYNYSTVDTKTSQFCIGSYITKEINSNLEIGTGLFLRVMTTSFDNYKAYDEYSWTGSIGTQYDTYEWTDTHVSPTSFKTDYVTNLKLSLPLVLQLNFGSGKNMSEISFIGYISSNPYLSMRFSYAFE